MLSVAATGTGKTLTVSHLVNLWRQFAAHYERSDRVLMLVHRDELVQQSRAKLLRVCAGEQVEIEQGEMRAERMGDSRLFDRRGRIVVASKDTLWRKRRLETFDPKEFGLITQE